MATFYHDDNVALQVGDELRSLGHEAHTSQGEGLKGATDIAQELHRFCAAGPRLENTLYTWHHTGGWVPRPPPS